MLHVGEIKPTPIRAREMASYAYKNGITGQWMEFICLGQTEQLRSLYVKRPKLLFLKFRSHRRAFSIRIIKRKKENSHFSVKLAVLYPEKTLMASGSHFPWRALPSLTSNVRETKDPNCPGSYGIAVTSDSLSGIHLPHKFHPFVSSALIYSKSNQFFCSQHETHPLIMISDDQYSISQLLHLMIHSLGIEKTF